MDRQAYEERMKEKLTEVKDAWPRLPMSSIQEIADRALRADLHSTEPLPSFDEFCRRHRQMRLFKSDLGRTDQS